MEIITAIVSATVTLLVCLINNFYQHKSMENLLDYRLTELEKKVDKHNNLIDRTYKLEERQSVVERDIKVANHRIDDLEGK